MQLPLIFLPPPLNDHAVRELKLTAPKQFPVLWESFYINKFLKGEITFKHVINGGVLWIKR
ncbi:hypothetical protein AM233_22060 [Bacillus sp. FJAT-22058]|nr:hypothetical protein AM233_22060 [Bacillus sp. FJAT-22058]